MKKKKAPETVDTASTQRQSQAGRELELASEHLNLNGYHGPGADHPRKYLPNALQDAILRKNYRSWVQEYVSSCHRIGAEPNSHVKEILTHHGLPVPASELLGGENVSFRETYVGERGFIALMPLLDRNTRWRHLDASNNGLRNEAVLHLVDLLLRPMHAGRRFYIDLSRNQISEMGGKALMELVKLHPGIESLNLSMTQIPRRLIERIRRQIEHEKSMREPDPLAVAEVVEGDGEADGENPAETPKGEKPAEKPAGTAEGEKPAETAKGEKPADKPAEKQAGSVDPGPDLEPSVTPAGGAAADMQPSAVDPSTDPSVIADGAASAEMQPAAVDPSPDPEPPVTADGAAASGTESAAVDPSAVDPSSDPGPSVSADGAATSETQPAAVDPSVDAVPSVTADGTAASEIQPAAVDPSPDAEPSVTADGTATS